MVQGLGIGFVSVEARAEEEYIERRSRVIDENCIASSAVDVEEREISRAAFNASQTSKETPRNRMRTRDWLVIGVGSEKEEEGGSKKRVAC